MNDSEEARRADQPLKETIIQQGIIIFLCIDKWLLIQRHPQLMVFHPQEMKIHPDNNEISPKSDLFQI
jgi:predicted ATPase